MLWSQRVVPSGSWMDNFKDGRQRTADSSGASDALCAGAYKVIMHLALAASSPSDVERARSVSAASTALGQLEQASARLLSAMSSTAESERAIRHCQAAANEFRTRVERVLAHSPAHDEVSELAQGVLVSLERSLAELKRSASAAGRPSPTNAATGAAASSLDESMAFLGQSLTNVETISSRIKMISLNAAVEAARLGQHGSAFAVIATALRDLSAETETAVASMRDNLALHKHGDS
ncbi:MAG: methyl-accepting chemotaxis protein [Pseudomonadota bacterium]